MTELSPMANGAGEHALEGLGRAAALVERRGAWPKESRVSALASCASLARVGRECFRSAGSGCQQQKEDTSTYMMPAERGCQQKDDVSTKTMLAGCQQKEDASRKVMPAGR